MSEPIGPGEVWREIAGTHGDYQVSPLGRVRRTRSMRWGQLPAWGIVRCQPNNHGYLMFNTICRGRRINKALHKIVIEAFVGPPIPGFHAAHLNGIQTDCSLGNLKYVSPAANAFHKIAHGTHNRGERSPMAKITEAQAREIIASSEPYPVLAARYGLTRFHVNDIHRGASWKHLHAEILL